MGMLLIQLSISNRQERREENFHVTLSLWMTLISAISNTIQDFYIKGKISANNTKAATNYKTENTFSLGIL
jgi:hypothetical protein